ncbi:MAG: bifunctional riboflavin kinase/FAD synthetase [Clostridiales Family XIII bacterium]|jgi:riboflavin kinase/FMN adenylyltransferase|nr:bifunctional riboflavin kinase/FAD synthetase [Clostridiales Family XIII bacterium]
MLTFDNLDEICGVEACAVAMGNFDGMHVGHVRLIGMAVDGARRRGLRSAVFTFSGHPRNMLAGGGVAVKNIQYPQEKAEMIRSLGVDYLFSIPFTQEIRRMPPDAYIDGLLLKSFGMAAAYCGFNYRFGYLAAGDADALRAAGRARGFEVFVLGPQKVGGALASSSLIRAMIAEGRMEECAALLGREYSVRGVVAMGNRIGRTIGFPTLNIHVDSDMVTPSHGVYITNCYFDGMKWPGVTNVGVRPTIGDEKKSIETHLLDFDGDLYGKPVRVEFASMLREERRFAGVEQLAEQIGRDSMAAREYHREKNKIFANAPDL